MRRYLSGVYKPYMVWKWIGKSYLLCLAEQKLEKDDEMIGQRP